MKPSSILGILILLIFINIAPAASPKNGPASEMYIKGFMEHFDKLDPEQQSAIVSGINDLGKKFEIVLDSAEYYIDKREKRIAALKDTPAESAEKKHSLQRKIIEEYLYTNFDSAFITGKKNLELAKSINRPDLITDSRIDLTNTFIQGGYFREAAEQLDSIDYANLDATHKTHVLLTRFFLEFENGFFFAWNQQTPDVAEIRMKQLYPELIGLLPDDAYDIYKLKATLSFYKHQYRDATGYCDILLLKDNNPNSWNYISQLGNMGYNKLGAHDYLEAMDYMVKSATLAIRKGATNNPALRKIAELLYVIGNDRLASKVINKSMDFATDYNSKYRIIESAKGYPMINRQLQSHIERNHRTMVCVSIIMAILVVLLAISLWYSRKQHQKVNQQSQIISQYNETLKERNTEIEHINTRLSEIHGVTGVLTSRMLLSASTRQDLVEKLRKDINLKLKVRQYEDIPPILDRFHKEMKGSQMDIDEILLAFFPDFVTQFNLLLKEENRLECKNGVLTPEIRIFALWRIGIQKNESIAKCMNYSLNTIKSYKTRIINASLYEKEEFYRRLMEIKVVLTD